MKLAFISPTKHLNLSAKGDFDFCLAHMILKDKKYRDYFIKQKRKGRMVVCDPSVHEKERIDESQVVKFLFDNDICTHYVMYDVMFDKDRTINHIREFLKLYKPIFKKKNIKLIGVAQGKNLKESLEAFEWLNNNNDIDVIGIPFDTDFISNDENVNCNQMFSRVYFLWKVATLNNVKKPVHALGLNNPLELGFIKHFDFIKSNDTKLPIRCAINNYEFNKQYGLINKPKRKLEFNDKLSEKQIQIAIKNINYMHGLVK